MQNDYAPLCSLLGSETAATLNNIPFRFKIPQKNMLMKTLQSGNSYITVMVNKSEEARNVELILKDDGMRPIILYANKQGIVSQKTVTIAPEETMVIQWNHQNKQITK
jgi:beta-galactosidase